MTVIFSDGFESGDLGAWSGTLISSGNTFTVVSDQRHHGSYAGKGYIDGTANSHAAVYKQYATTYSVLYARGYFRFSKVPTGGNRMSILRHAKSGAYTNIVEVRVKDVSGYPRFGILPVGGVETYYSGIVVEVDRWYCIELYCKVGAGDGEVRLYIDGVEVLTQTGLTNDAYGNIGRLMAGVWDCWVTESYTWVDCVVVADTYIGLEPTGQLYEIPVDAPCRSLAAISQECIFNIAEDAVASSQAAHAPESTFNLQKDAVTQALSNAIIELVTGLIEIFKDAMATAQAAFALESAFNINKDAVAEASASPGICGVYPISVEAAAKAGATALLRQILGIGKDAVVVTVSTPLIQSAFNIRPEANVKLLAEVAAVKEGEIKVTRLFLIVGNLAIQLTRS
ncbi:MAG: hypothetical protein QXZ25_00190 [Candidatus Bathyarchaeia archaeon]